MDLQSIEDTREAAKRRIHQEDLDRQQAALDRYELDKAHAIFLTEQFCAQFGAGHVMGWAERFAKRNGQAI